jgi:hypothetical protein
LPPVGVAHFFRRRQHMGKTLFENIFVDGRNALVGAAAHEDER